MIPIPLVCKDASRRTFANYHFLFREWLNAPTPAQISVEDALKASGPDAVYYRTQMRRVSNARQTRTEFSAAAVGVDR